MAILAETWYFSITPGVLSVYSSFSIVEIMPTNYRYDDLISILLSWRRQGRLRVFPGLAEDDAWPG